jgi:hypothetical protein
MLVYNKGHRDIIVALKDVTPNKDAVPQESKTRYHIKPEMIIEVNDDVAATLINQYPREIVEWGKR